MRGLLTVTAPAFDPARAWRLHPQVAVRPEPFKRCSVATDESLSDHRDARSACNAAGIAESDQTPYLHALGVLAGSEMLVAEEES